MAKETEQRTLSAFTVAELNRLVEMIPKTDPHTMEYGQLLSNLERYGAICGMVDSIIFGRETDGYKTPDHPVADTPFPEEGPKNVKPFKKKEEPIKAEPVEEPVKEDPPAEEPAEEPEAASEYDEATVKKALVTARKTKELNVTAWLKDNFGVSGFQNLPASEYGKAMALLAEL